ncbi:hypothetical protein KQX54_013821 [Cotesia glomerata]|uniref:EGF-like domain-containing protein n=1 Tax=Cotesia glomerata TaxID=32391 RepID=A0AAV7IQN0_COTGL|nr:hypothetical protein KQX54_013821 [Cotesia glomerata]
MYDQRPCCDSRDICQRKNTSYVCNKRELGFPCENDNHCSHKAHAECSSDKKCACKWRHQQINKMACVPLVGERCLKNESCATQNSTCIDNKCQCRRGLLRYKHLCVGTLLGRSCKQDSDCQALKFSICSRNICICAPKTIVSHSSVCLSLLNLACTKNDQCKVQNSICIEKKCQCGPGYVDRESKCVPRNLDEPCRNNSDCSQLAFAVCSSNKCVCDNNYNATSKTQCVPLLGGGCNERFHCTVPNSECIGSKCQCKAYHSVIGNNKCIPVTIGSFCNSNADCDSTRNFKCSEDKVCACKDNSVAVLNSLQCSSVLNGYCLKNSECIFNGFHCIDNRCQCKPDYTQVSSHQCHESKSVFLCYDLLDCGDAWHYQCHENKCICASHHISINNATCYPILGGNCWDEHQCLTKDSECFDFHCRCKHNFIPVSDNSCIPK